MIVSFELSIQVHAASNPLGAVLDSNNKIIGYIDGSIGTTNYTGVINDDETVGSSDFYGGSFDWVDFYQQSGTNLFPLGGTNFNNIFKLTPSTGALDQMIGPGSLADPMGVTGPVFALQKSSQNDLYVGGQFSAAGGNVYSANIAVYLSSGNWQFSSIFSCFVGSNSYVDSLSIVTNSQGKETLRVSGNFDSAYANHSGPYGNSISVSDDTAYLQDIWYWFGYTYFTDEAN